MTATRSFTVAALLVLGMLASGVGVGVVAADECDGDVDTNCNHYSAPSNCILYLGDEDGRCIVWSNGSAS